MRRSFTLSRGDPTRGSGACRTPSGRSRFGLRTGDTVKGQIHFTGGIAKSRAAARSLRNVRPHAKAASAEVSRFRRRTLLNGCGRHAEPTHLLEDVDGRGVAKKVSTRSGHASSTLGL